MEKTLTRVIRRTENFVVGVGVGFVNLKKKNSFDFVLSGVCVCELLGC